MSQRRRIAINGFGRIGRLTFRAVWAKQLPEIEIVAINDPAGAHTGALLLEYDSNYGQWKRDIRAVDGGISVDGRVIKVFAERDPGAIPWGSVGVEIVIEATGLFTDGTKAVAHKRDSVRKVIISAPAKNEDVTVVLGVNADKYDPAKHHVISNARCTTNGLAPSAEKGSL